mgnify:CR=1 FL=1
MRLNSLIDKESKDRVLIGDIIRHEVRIKPIRLIWDNLCGPVSVQINLVSSEVLSYLWVSA